MKLPLLARGRAIRASFTELKFRNPLPHPARVAVLDKLVSGSDLRIFKLAQSDDLQAFRPAILAGTLDALRGIEAVRAGLKTVVIFSSSPITDDDRDWLWHKFQVPCFEQLLGPNGRVIAEECDGHCGLHVLEPAALSGTLTSVECECGRAEPRLLT